MIKNGREGKPVNFDDWNVYVCWGENIAKLASISMGWTFYVLVKRMFLDEIGPHLGNGVPLRGPLICFCSGSYWD